jgi:preprotein translocase subunit SecA
MTGTAETEATEFFEIYKLPVVVIPTNRPCIRADKNDSIFKTRRDKYNAVVKEIETANKRGQPVLVGTVSVEASEVLSRMLKRTGVIHAVLNAKFHQQEAEIVTRAGQRGSVTIATNMAGRGTDIKLGEGVMYNVAYESSGGTDNLPRFKLTEPQTGETQYLDEDSDAVRLLQLRPSSKICGGLYVIGTERHESRRIDRQLRGRCARQGDPGMSKFFLSLEDDLMRLFLQGNLASKLMEGSMKEGEELEHSLLNRSIESAQKKVEQQNFSIRKRLLQYDDVLNQQREVVYGIRNGAIHSERPKDIIFEMIDEELAVRLENTGLGEKTGAPTSSVESFVGWVNQTFPVGLKVADVPTSGDVDAIAKGIVERIKQCYGVKEQVEIPEALGALERYVVINAIDHHWQEHLTDMEELRRSIGLRSYGQKDPLVEYKGEAYKYFEEMMSNVRLQICTGLFRSATNLQSFENMLNLLSRNARLEGPDNEPPAAGVVAGLRPPPNSSGPNTTARIMSSAATESMPPAPPDAPEIQLPKVTIRREVPKVGRNEPCPCGSGKKYKQCCGK